MKVRIQSKQQGGGTVTTGLIDKSVAEKMKKLLEKQYPNDKHTIIRAGKTIVKGGYQKNRVKA